MQPNKETTLNRNWITPLQTQPYNLYLIELVGWVTTKYQLNDSNSNPNWDSDFFRFVWIIYDFDNQPWRQDISIDGQFLKKTAHQQGEYVEVKYEGMVRPISI